MKFHSFIFFTLLNINILVGQYFELPRLGVLDFEPRAVPISLTQRFTEAFRNELENTNLAQVIDRGSLLSVVEERGYIRSNCITDYCEALVGRLLDANFILNGSIAYADSIYTIDINMVSVKTGAIDKTVTLRVFGDYQNSHPKMVAYYDKYFPAPESSLHYYTTYIELVIAYNFYKETGATVCGLWDIFTKDDARYVLLINKTMEELKNDYLKSVYGIS